MKFRRARAVVRLISIPALMLASLAGCSGSESPVGPSTGSALAVPPSASAVEFEVVQEMTTEISGITESRRAVIVDAEEWTALWDRIVTFVAPKPPAPPIEFDSRMVVFASMGERSSGGYSISVLEAAEEEGTLYVVVEESTPGVECMTTDVVTTPAVAVSVPRTASTVLFVEREIAYPCGPM